MSASNSASTDSTHGKILTPHRHTFFLDTLAYIDNNAKLTLKNVDARSAQHQHHVLT